MPVNLKILGGSNGKAVTISQAIKNGEKAFEQGLGTDRCPHHPLHEAELRNAWFTGFKGAKTANATR